MVVTVDTVNKTITIDSPVTLEDLLRFIENLEDGKEYSVISKTHYTCYPNYDWNKFGQDIPYTQPQIVY